MIVITPISITDAILTSSTVPEPDTGEVAWAAGPTYALGDVRYLAATHRIYESLQAGNIGHDPSLDTQGDPDNPPVWWMEIGPTNKWKMFDLLRNTQTDDVSPLTIVLTPGAKFDSLALVGLEADEVTISRVVSAVEVYSYSGSLSTREVVGWYTYFFESFSTMETKALFDVPPYAGGTLTITLTSASGTVKCGGALIGMQTYIGETQLNAESDVLNFSRVDRAFDGTASLIQRRSIPKTNQRIFTDKALVNKVRALRTALNAVPAFYSGLDDDTDGYFGALQIVGIYKRFTINLSDPVIAVIDLEVEEI